MEKQKCCLITANPEEKVWNIEFPDLSVSSFIYLATFINEELGSIDQKEMMDILCDKFGLPKNQKIDIDYILDNRINEPWLVFSYSNNFDTKTEMSSLRKILKMKARDWTKKKKDLHKFAYIVWEILFDDNWAKNKRVKETFEIFKQE